MYTVKLNNGETINSSARNYEELMCKLIGLGIKHKQINKIWMVTLLDVDYYNKLERKIKNEEG